MSIACCVLLGVWYCVEYCLLWVARKGMLVVGRFLCVDCLFVAYGLLFAVRAMHCLLFVVGLLMSVVCCFLFDVC